MLPTEYQQFIHLSRYARWDYDKEEEKHGTKQLRDTLIFLVDI